MIALILPLAACGNVAGSRGREAFEDFRNRYSALETVQLTSDITADCGLSQFNCRLRYEYEGGAESVTVIEPEVISGITARPGESGAEIVYDNIILDIGPLNESGLTPVSALFAATDAWKNGIFSEASTVSFADCECWQVTFCPVESSQGESITQTLVFSKESCRPLFSEIFSDGERKITIEFIY